MNERTVNRTGAWCLMALGLASCAAETSDDTETGQVILAVEGAEDVTAVTFRVFGPGHLCEETIDGFEVANATVVVDVDPPGINHRGANHIFALPPDFYHFCAIPLALGGEPS